MIIMVDVDNVICNLQEIVVNLFNERHGTEYTLNDFTEYSVMSILPTEEAILMQQIYGEPGLYNLVKPLPGAVDGLQKLINSGHNVYLVTDAIPDTYGEKVRFINRYFPFIDDAHIVSMKHKHLFKCDVMIEDNLTNLLAKPYYHRVVFNWPWNQVSGRNTELYDETHALNRCYTWDDVLTVINEINNWE